MSKPVKGNPAVDAEAKELLAMLKKHGATFYKNLSLEIIGEFVEELGRHNGLANRHQGVKLSQKTGGVQGSLRNHIRIGVHTSGQSIEEIEARYPASTEA